MHIVADVLGISHTSNQSKIMGASLWQPKKGCWCEIQYTALQRSENKPAGNHYLLVYSPSPSGSHIYSTQTYVHTYHHAYMCIVVQLVHTYNSYNKKYIRT